MDSDGIILVCETLGLNYGRVYNAGGHTNDGEKRGPHIQISCPRAWDRSYHSGSDEKPSCSVSVDPFGPSKARCWSANCAFKGSFKALIEQAVMLRRVGRRNKELAKLIKFVREAEAVNLSADLDRTRRRVMLMPTTRGQVPAMSRYRTIPESRLARFDPALHPYAVSRNLTEEMALRWGLVFDPERQSLVFPVRAVRGELVGLVGRDVTSSNEKKNYPGLDKARHLFGGHLLEPGKPLIIVEGPIDCVRTDAFMKGEACTVATLGEGFSDDHVKTVRAMGPPCVYLFPDGDRAGKLIAQKITSALRKHVVLRLMTTPYGQDPGSLTGEEIRALFSEAVRVKKSISWSPVPANGV